MLRAQPRGLTHLRRPSHAEGRVPTRQPAAAGRLPSAPLRLGDFLEHLPDSGQHSPYCELGHCAGHSSGPAGAEMRGLGAGEGAGQRGFPSAAPSRVHSPQLGVLQRLPPRACRVPCSAPSSAPSSSPLPGHGFGLQCSALPMACLLFLGTVLSPEPPQRHLIRTEDIPITQTV